MHRLILNRQLVNVLVFRSVIVNGPTRRAEHQIPSLPLVSLPFDSAVTAALKVIIDSGGHMAVRAVNNIRRANRDGGKESMRRAIGATGGRVIHQIKPPSGIALSQVSELVQFSFDFFPGPMQWAD